MSTNLTQSFFTRLRSRLERITLSILPDREEAADVVQETFCRLWEIKERIGSEEEATALAVRTSRNLCIDTLRKQQRRQYMEMNEALTRPESSMEEEYEVLERFEQVQQLIETRLPPLQQTILKMKEIEGLETEEIATRLEMKATAVRMNLSRARNEIRTLYNNYFEQD